MADNFHSLSLKLETGVSIRVIYIYLSLFFSVIFTFYTTALYSHRASITFACQAIFLERVEFLSVTRKTKKIDVKGGFYSEEDMRTELGYTAFFGCMPA